MNQFTATNDEALEAYRRSITPKRFRVIYRDGKEIEVSAMRSLDVVKHLDLATRENIGTRIVQLA